MLIPLHFAMQNALLTASVKENMSLVGSATCLDWSTIAQRMNGSRSAEQCRHHWMYTLKHKQEGVKTGTWSKEEVSTFHLIKYKLAVILDCPIPHFVDRACFELW